MTYVRLWLLAFVIASFALALWLFVNWFDYSMADFDCAVEAQAACRRAAAGRVALAVGPAVGAWGVWALLLIRALKRA